MWDRHRVEPVAAECEVEETLWTLDVHENVAQDLSRENILTHYTQGDYACNC